MKKRILTLLMVMAMLLSAMAVSASAEEAVKLTDLSNRNAGIHDSIEAGALKAASGPLLEKVAGECMMLMGGTGVIRETGIERYYRDAKALEIACFSDKTFVDTVAATI